jgi:hypothetical protein
MMLNDPRQFDDAPSSGSPLEGEPSRSSPLAQLEALIVQAEKDHRAALEARLNVASKPELAAELQKLGEPNWDKIENLDIPTEQAKSIALQLFKSSKAQSGERIIVEATPGTLKIIAEVLALTRQNNVEVVFDFRNYAREAILANHLPDQEGSETLQDLAQSRLDLYNGIKKALRVVNYPDPAINQFTDTDKSNKLESYMAPRSKAFRNGELHYIVTIPPTAVDAARDGMTHKELLKLYLESCDQPWEAIKEAQGKLIEKFNQANRVRITNNPRYNRTNVCQLRGC